MGQLRHGAAAVVRSRLRSRRPGVGQDGGSPWDRRPDLPQWVLCVAVNAQGVFAALLDWLCWGQVLDLYSVLGFVLITVGGVWVITHEGKKWAEGVL